MLLVLAIRTRLFNVQDLFFPVVSLVHSLRNVSLCKTKYFSILQQRQAVAVAKDGDVVAEIVLSVLVSEGTMNKRSLSCYQVGLRDEKLWSLQGTDDMMFKLLGS
jgi:hypothetical protein